MSHAVSQFFKFVSWCFKSKCTLCTLQISNCNTQYPLFPGTCWHLFCNQNFSSHIFLGGRRCQASFFAIKVCKTGFCGHQNVKVRRKRMSHADLTKLSFASQLTVCDLLLCFLQIHTPAGLRQIIFCSKKSGEGNTWHLVDVKRQSTRSGLFTFQFDPTSYSNYMLGTEH